MVATDARLLARSLERKLFRLVETIDPLSTNASSHAATIEEQGAKRQRTIEPAEEDLSEFIALANQVEQAAMLKQQQQQQLSSLMERRLAERERLRADKQASHVAWHDDDYVVDVYEDTGDAADADMQQHKQYVHARLLADTRCWLLISCCCSVFVESFNEELTFDCEYDEDQHSDTDSNGTRHSLTRSLDHSITHAAESARCRSRGQPAEQLPGLLELLYVACCLRVCVSACVC